MPVQSCSAPRTDDDLPSEVLAAEPALLTSLDFGPRVHQGVGNGPSLLIGDQAEVALFPSFTQSHLDYRMACLAEPGDIVIVRQRDPVFEAYLNDVVGLSGITFLEADAAPPRSVTEQAISSGPLEQMLVEAATGVDGLNLKSYLTTGHTWRLAQHLGELSHADIYVCGPSPRLSRRVNDKLWFADLARRVIGRDSIPPSMSAYGPAAAAGLVAYFAKRKEHVIVKVPDSAGSAGNITLDSAYVRGLSLRHIRGRLVRRLAALGWQGRYPVLVGVWDEDVTSSPSVQLWIPRPKDGPAVVEGIFEQCIQGAEGEFVGAARSVLPPALQDSLGNEALQIASVLQQLGYFGRCSLDAVICEIKGSGDHIHWIECNGRWGGVSIPMTLAKKLCLGNEPAGLIILQDVRSDLATMGTGQFLKALDDLLFRIGTSTEGIVLLSPPMAARGVSVNLLVFAASQEDAKRLAAKALMRIEERGLT